MNYKELYNQVVDFSENKELLSNTSFILMALKNNKNLSKEAKEEELEKLFYSIKKDNSKIKKRDRRKLEKIIKKNNITFKEETKEAEKIEMFRLDYKYPGPNMIGGCSIYINIDRDQLYTLLQKVVKSYTEEDLPFTCIAGSINNYNYQLEFIIPADKAPSYVELLQEIGDKSLRIKNSCEKPPIFTGNIDNWIGFICNTDEKKSNKVIDDDTIIKEITTAYDTAENMWKKNHPDSTDYYRNSQFLNLFSNILKTQINRPRLSFSETAEKDFVKNTNIKKQITKKEQNQTIKNNKLEEQEALDLAFNTLNKIAIMNNYTLIREQGEKESTPEYIQYLKEYKEELYKYIEEKHIITGKYQMTNPEINIRNTNPNINLTMTDEKVQQSKQKLNELTKTKKK